MQLRTEKSKARQNEKLLDDNQYFMESGYEMHPDNRKQLDGDIDALKKCIEELKQEQKECIKLFYLEEKCYQEISEELEYDLKKVKSHIQNGKRNLKICIEKNG